MADSSQHSPAETQKYPVIPIRDVVIFPSTKVAFKVGRPSSIKALEAALEGDRKIFIVTQRDPSIETPTPENLYEVGTVALILKVEPTVEAQHKIIIEGLGRARIIQINKSKGAFEAKVIPVSSVIESGKAITKLRQRIGVVIAQYLPVMLNDTSENIKVALHAYDPDKMVDGISSLAPLISVEDKQELLETPSVQERLQKLIFLLEATDVNQQSRAEELDIVGVKSANESTVQRTPVFIGHGRSPLWARVKLFLEDELALKTVSYESESRAGQSIITILESMLNEASFAVLILTAEDETVKGNKRARQNVIHEAGLFQGRLGFEKAIMLVQEGLENFSNVAGLQNIIFTGDRIDQTFYELQKVLRREGLVQ